LIVNNAIDAMQSAEADVEGALIATVVGEGTGVSRRVGPEA
jgi:hypothetical protein